MDQVHTAMNLLWELITVCRTGILYLNHLGCWGISFSLWWCWCRIMYTKDFIVIICTALGCSSGNIVRSRCYRSKKTGREFRRSNFKRNLKLERGSFANKYTRYCIRTTSTISENCCSQFSIPSVCLSSSNTVSVPRGASGTYYLVSLILN